MDLLRKILQRNQGKILTSCTYLDKGSLYTPVVSVPLQCKIFLHVQAQGLCKSEKEFLLHFHKIHYMVLPQTNLTIRHELSNKERIKM